MVEMCHEILERNTADQCIWSKSRKSLQNICNAAAALFPGIKKFCDIFLAPITKTSGQILPCFPLNDGQKFIIFYNGIIAYLLSSDMNFNSLRCRIFVQKWNYSAFPIID